MIGRRDDDDRMLFLSAVCFSIAVISWLVYQQFFGRTPSDIQAATPDAAVMTPSCGNILESCAVSKEIRLDKCETKLALGEASKKLGNVNLLPECQRAMDRLEAGCPAGCALDPGSVIRVPGKLELELDPSRDESGMCGGVVGKHVSIRGTCVRP